jgi:hypothetical protein
MAVYDGFVLMDTYQYDTAENENAAMGRFYVPVASIGNRPVLGNACPASLTGTWYVDRVQAVPESAVSYTVTIWFRDYLYLPVSVIKASSAELDADTRVTYDMGAFFVSPAMLGLKRKTHGDAVDLTATSATLADWTPAAKTAGVQQTEAAWALNTWVPAACPFTKRPHWKFLNQSRETTIGICRFNVAKASLTSTTFRGVNTNANIPAGFDLDERTTAGMWRAMRQSSGNVTSRGGTAYRPVKRWLVHPPRGGDFAGTALVWDSDKCGGTFAW